MNRTAPYRLMSREERIAWWTSQWRRTVPGLVTLALIVLMTAPIFAPLPLMPQLGLLGVFIWAMFQPAMMPPWLAFLLGIASDLLFGLPLGVNATLLPLIAMFVRGFEARFGHHVYRFDWLMLAALALVFQLLGWQAARFAGNATGFAPLLVQWLTTVAAYPAVVMLCAALQRRFIGSPA